jgi:N-acetylglucosamine-6-sulfatase
MTIDKRMPYETDIRIPMLIRGPGIVPGTTTDELALLIDLAPTILDMAGIERPSHMDGKSLLPFISDVREIDERHKSYALFVVTIQSPGIE